MVKDEFHRYYFEIFDQNVEDIFLRYVEHNKTTVSKFVNLALLLALTIQPGLTKDERHLLKAAVKKTEVWCKTNNAAFH